MANKLVGEVEVQLLGKKHVLKPTVEAICQIEDAGGPDASVPIMFLQVTRQSIKFKTVGLVLYGCLRANGVETTLDAVMADVKRQGIAEFIAPVGGLLRDMCTPDEAEEEAKKEAPEPTEGSTG